MWVAANCSEGDERGELGVGDLVRERGGAGDGGVEVTRPGFAEAVLEGAVNAVEVGVQPGTDAGVERGADADIDLRGCVAVASE